MKEMKALPKQNCIIGDVVAKNGNMKKKKEIIYMSAYLFFT